MNTKYKAAVQQAVEEENRRWNDRGPVSVANELVGVRPAGVTPADSAIVITALAVTKLFTASEPLREGSTDSNVPMNLGIPAMTIGGGGRARAPIHWTKRSTPKIPGSARSADCCWQ